jgi:zinc and cadmium transporter
MWDLVSLYLLQACWTPFLCICLSYGVLVLIRRCVYLVDVWIASLISVIVVSLISLVGAVTLVFNGDLSKGQLMALVGFSAGGMLGGAFLHLIPEAFNKFSSDVVSIYLVLGVFSSFTVEMLLEWRHCHVPTCDDHPHSFAYVNLLGDGVHNFIDGLIIGGSYLVSFGLGLSTTLAVIMHEIPQEIGDFGVLIYAGMKPGKALLFNLISALTSIIGALLVLGLGSSIGGLSEFLVPFAAGNFVYIAGSDLVPELKDQKDVGRGLFQLGLMGLGVLLMYMLKGVG